MRLEGIAKGGYYPTPEIVVKELARMMSPPGRFSTKTAFSYPILDPCAGEGAAVKELKRLLIGKQAKEGVPEHRRSSFPTYGIEPNLERAEKATENLDETLNNDFFRCALSHNAFSILWLNPPYDYNQEEKRMEHRFLTRCHNYLMPGGLLVYIIPRQTLRTSAAFLSAHYCDYRWQVYQFPEEEYKHYNQIVFIGQKSERNPNTPAHSDTDAKEKLLEISQESNKLWELDSQKMKYVDYRVYVTNRVNSTTSDYFYLKPSDNADNILFTAYHIDPQQMQQLVNRHGLWKEKEVQQLIQYTSELKQQPLMPLRKGHLALFIAAGFLNNMELTDEKTGERILIKGNSHKEKHVRDDEDNKIIEQEVLAVKIHMLSLETGLLTEII